VYSARAPMRDPAQTAPIAALLRYLVDLPLALEVRWPVCAGVSVCCLEQTRPPGREQGVLVYEPADPLAPWRLTAAAQVIVL
jgi:hypothetical protein